MPDRLVPFLPGIYGKDVVEAEVKRLANAGEPMRQIPAGVSNSANMADAEDFVNPLRGYAYDSFNPDALLSAKVVNGNVVFESGATYKLLIIPGKSRLNPNNDWMSLEVAEKLLELAKSGARILISEKPKYQPGLQQVDAVKYAKVVDELWNGNFSGNIIRGIYHDETFDKIGIARDLMVKDNSKDYAKNIAYTHRQDGLNDIYFISNQEEKERVLEFSFRRESNVIELYDPVANRKWHAKDFRFENNRTVVPVKLAPNASLFVIFKKATKGPAIKKTQNWTDFENLQTIAGPWKVSFDSSLGGPEKAVVFNNLTDWSSHADTLIKYYSGTASYTKTFISKVSGNKPVWLDLGKVANLAEVKVNGQSCGIVWTPPNRVDISKALKKGTNSLTIEVTNTWANRLMGDQRLPENKRITKTTAPYRLEGKPLQEAGLLGPIVLMTER